MTPSPLPGSEPAYPHGAMLMFQSLGIAFLAMFSWKLAVAWVFLNLARAIERGWEWKQLPKKHELDKEAK